MKVETSLLMLGLCLVAVTCFAANESMMGTWKLDEAKSKLAAGGPKNNTVTYEAAGDSIKVTIEGTAADGSALHSEWTGKFDGKDYPSTGNPNEDMRSSKQIDDHTLHVTSKKDGKVVLVAHVVISADGKSRTVTVTGTDAKGKKYKSVACTTSNRRGDEGRVLRKWSTLNFLMVVTLMVPFGPYVPTWRSGNT